MVVLGDLQDPQLGRKSSIIVEYHCIKCRLGLIGGTAACLGKVGPLTRLDLNCPALYCNNTRRASDRRFDQVPTGYPNSCTLNQRRNSWVPSFFRGARMGALPPKTMGLVPFLLKST